MNPIPLLIGFIVGSLFSIGLGAYFVKRGLRGIQEQEFPLTDQQNVTGTTAQIAGGIMAALGILSILSGIAIIVFGIWRISQLNSA